MKDAELIAEIMKKVKQFDGSAESAIEIIAYLKPIFIQFKGRPQGISEKTLREIQNNYTKFSNILFEEKQQLSKKINELSGARQKRIVDAYAKHIQTSMKMIF